MTDGLLHNNGLDSEFTDLGAGGVTGLPEDMGRFKTPTLRNVALTALHARWTFPNARRGDRPLRLGWTSIADDRSVHEVYPGWIATVRR
jgi:hypothetical protein